MKIAGTEAELVLAKSKLEEAEASGDEAKIAKYENGVIRKVNQKLEKKNLLMKAGAGNVIVAFQHLRISCEAKVHFMILTL